MGYQPDPANQPTPPLDDYDNASETSPPLEEIVGAAGSEATGQAADPAADGPGVYSWDTLDEHGRALRRARAAAQPAESGVASTYNAGYSDRQA
jgi:hypothetical protein